MKRLSKVLPIAGGLAAIGILLSGCDPSTYSSNWGETQYATAAPPSAKPAATRGDAILVTRQCGKALGIAVRCNLVRDDRDFAVIRYAVLQGLGDRYDTVATNDEIAEQLDLATLDRLTSLGNCSVPPADMARVEQGVRQSVASCSQK